MRETWVWSMGQADPLEKEMATHSSTLAWKILWATVHGVTNSRTGLSNFTSLILSYENLIDTVHNSKKEDLNVKHNNKKASDALSFRTQVTPDLSFLGENFDDSTSSMEKESLSQVCFFGLTVFCINVLCSSYWADLPFYYSGIVGSFWHKTLLSLTSFKHAHNSKNLFHLTRN